MVAPWYKEAARTLKQEGIAFGAMNMDLHGERGRSYGVKGTLLCPSPPVKGTAPFALLQV